MRSDRPSVMPIPQTEAGRTRSRRTPDRSPRVEQLVVREPLVGRRIAADDAALYLEHEDPAVRVRDEEVRLAGFGGPPEGERTCQRRLQKTVKSSGKSARIGCRSRSASLSGSW